MKFTELITENESHYRLLTDKARQAIRELDEFFFDMVEDGCKIDSKIAKSESQKILKELTKLVEKMTGYRI